MSQTDTQVPVREVIEPGTPPPPPGLMAEMVNAIRKLIVPHNQELITILRMPTPIKVSRVFVTDSHGCIGNGLDVPDPETIYTAPVSSEVWLHRITTYSPEYPPSSPLTAGELLFTGSTAGEIIWFLPEQPDNTQVAPMTAYEGSLSAPHLNAGEQLFLVGDQFPVGIHLRVDLQIVQRQGTSEYTPRTMSPTDLDISKGTDVS